MAVGLIAVAVESGYRSEDGNKRMRRSERWKQLLMLSIIKRPFDS